MGSHDSYHADTLLRVLLHLGPPNNRNKQEIQLKIIKKLFQFQSVKDLINNNFHNIILSLNIKLFNFVITELSVDIGRLFDGLTVLEYVVLYLVYNPDINNEFAYEMFGHLLSLGADIKQINKYQEDVNYFINQIANQNIKDEINLMIENSGEYRLIKERLKRNYNSLSDFDSSWVII